MIIETLEQLTSLHKSPTERAVGKELQQLEPHSKRFIELSPFLVLSTANAAGQADSSPRGGAPGFVKVTGDKQLLIPDAPGNNRLDSLRNILETKQVGLLFFLPGIEETLRVNGRATLSTDPALLQLVNDESWTPKLVIQVEIEALYMHCAKAILRCKLWSAAAQIERDAFPTIGQILKDQLGLDGPAEPHGEMLRRYAPDL